MKKILLVIDNQANLSALSSAIEEGILDCLVTSTLSEPEAEMQVGQVSPDLIIYDPAILDSHGGLTGFAHENDVPLIKFRGAETGPETDVIMEGAENGALINWPLETEKLSELIENILSKSGRKGTEETSSLTSEQMPDARSQALKRIQSRYQNIYNLSLDVIYLHDFDGNILDANPAALSILGYEPGEFQALNMAELLDSGQMKTAVKVMEEIRETGYQKGTTEYRLRKKNGDHLHVETRAAVVYVDGHAVAVQGVARDITDRVHAEHQLKESEARYRELFEFTEDGVAVFRTNDNADFTLVDINTAGERIEKIAKEDVLGKDFFEVFDQLTGFGLEKAIADVYKSGQAAHFPITSMSEGRLVFQRENFIYRLPSGELVVVFRDETEKVLAEEEARQHQEQLIRTTKMTSLGILIAGIAHEINNPLATVMLNGTTLEQIWRFLVPILDERLSTQGDFKVGGLTYSQLKERMPSILSDLVEGTQQVKLTVESLRDYAREKPPELSDKVNLGEVVDNAVRLVWNLIKNSTSRFSRNIPTNLPSFKGDFQALSQVTVNLLLNACQALPNQDKGITVSAVYNENSEHIILYIADEGVGIAPENLDKVKDPFFTTKRGEGGAGLGLSTADKIVMAHNGVLELESTLGVGTTVKVRLPV